MPKAEPVIRTVQPSSRLAFKFAWRISVVIAALVILLAVVISISRRSEMTDLIDAHGRQIVSAEAAHPMEYWLKTSTTGANPLEKLAADSDNILNIIVMEGTDLQGDALLAAVESDQYKLLYDKEAVTRPDGAEGVRIADGRFTKGSERSIDAHLFWKTIPARGDGKPGTVFLILSAEQVERSKWAFLPTLLIVGALAVAFGIGFSFLLAAQVTRPVRELATDMGRVSRGDLDHKAKVHGGDEIGMLGRAFNRMILSLRDAREQEAQNRAIERELAIAKEIQAVLLPAELPNLPDYDLHCYYEPAKEVGGDYYDFIPVDPKHLGVVVADVSGKGIPGCMVMTMVRSVIRYESHGIASAKETLKRVNRRVGADIKRGMFVTAAYLVVDIAAAKVTIASAGHNPLIWYSSDSRRCKEIKPEGMALGLDKGPAFEEGIDEMQITLAPGDRIVAYTDGIVEAMNEDGAEYGEKRFVAACERLAELPSEEFVDQIIADVRAHQGKAEQHDDITLCTFRYTGAAHRA